MTHTSCWRCRIALCDVIILLFVLWERTRLGFAFDATDGDCADVTIPRSFLSYSDINIENDRARAGRPNFGRHRWANKRPVNVAFNFKFWGQANIWIVYSDSTDTHTQSWFRWHEIRTWVLRAKNYSQRFNVKKRKKGRLSPSTIVRHPFVSFPGDHHFFPSFSLDTRLLKSCTSICICFLTI